MRKVDVGIDIGTTNISVMALDVDEGGVAQFFTLPNRRIESKERYSYLQDPHAIEKDVRVLLGNIEGSIQSICVTGQVHGILYYDKEGLALSPLYTWLDQRSLERIDSINSVDLLYEKTQIRLPSGYGFVTHYANKRMDNVPTEAAGFCGIIEYITQRLIAKVLTKSDSSSLGTYGGFDPVTSSFNPLLIREVFKGDSFRALSASKPFEIAGYTPEGVAVAYPVGDNQAGFFGMVPSWKNSALISIGTSGQLSIFKDRAIDAPSMEMRPFFEKGYLYVGATLAAGKAYELLHSLLSSIAKGVGSTLSDQELFTYMREEALKEGDSSLVVDTRFCGSRKEPTLKGSIGGIDLNNFTVGNLVLSFVEGVVKELHNFIKEEKELFSSIDSIVAVGSGVKKNSLFKESLKKEFALPIQNSDSSDEACYGAALIGSVASGSLTLEQVKEIVSQKINR